MAVKKIFRRLAKTPGDVKLAPQEAVVFDAIPMTKGGIERGELVTNLEALATGDDPQLKTKQSVASILGYYTKHLVDSGLIEVERVEEPAAKEESKAA